MKIKVGKAVSRALGGAGKSVAKVAAIPAGIAAGVATGNPAVGMAVAGGVRALGGGKATLKNSLISAGAAGLGNLALSKIGGLSGITSKLSGISSKLGSIGSKVGLGGILGSGGLGNIFGSTLGKVGLGLAGAYLLGGKKAVTGEGPSVSERVHPYASTADKIFKDSYALTDPNLIRSRISSIFTPEQLQSITNPVDVTDLKNKVNSLYNDTMNKYSDLISSASNIDQLVQNQLNKTNTALGLGGLVNTPALQRTHSDIISSLNFEKISKINDLLTSRIGAAESLLPLPYKVQGIAEEVSRSKLGNLSNLLNINLMDILTPFDMKMKVGASYLGIPYDTVVQPGKPGLLDTLGPAAATVLMDRFLKES